MKDESQRTFDDKEILKRYVQDEILPKAIIAGLLLIFILMGVSFR